MQDQLSVKVEQLGRDALINAAKRRRYVEQGHWAVSTPLFRLLLTISVAQPCVSDDDLFAPMAVDAMLAVKTTNTRGEIKYPVKAVNVLKAHGRSARESLFVQGYALNCTVASQGMFDLLQDEFIEMSNKSAAMKTRITSAKIACLDIDLRKTRMQLGVQILVDDPEQLEEIRKR